MAAVTEEHALAAKKLKTKAKASLALLLVAVISITTATYAWFTLSNSTSVQEMTVQVTTGVALKVCHSPDAVPTDDVKNDVWKSVLDNDYVNSALSTDYPAVTGTRPTAQTLDSIRLWPLTSGNGYRLYTQNGNTVPNNAGVDGGTGYLLELRLWFIASADMDVYLNGDGSPNLPNDAHDATLIQSHAENQLGVQDAVERAARISFAAYPDRTPWDTIGAAPETSVIYEPNKTEDTLLAAGNNAWRDNENVPQTVQPTFVTLGSNAGVRESAADNRTTVLFSLKANVPKQVVIRLWIEGEDPQCVNGNGTGENVSVNLSDAKLLARLRFSGADKNGNLIEGSA